MDPIFEQFRTLAKLLYHISSYNLLISLGRGKVPSRSNYIAAPRIGG